jgi:hypothetical protein
MKFKTKFSSVVEFILLVIAIATFALPAPGQFNIYDGTTPVVLLAPGTYSGTNFAVSADIPSYVYTNGVAKPTSSPDCSMYIGKCSLVLIADTNSTGLQVVSVVSSNVVGAVMATNTFASFWGSTNATQVIPFDTSTNGTKLFIRTALPTTNQFGIYLIGRTRYQ